MKTKDAFALRDFNRQKILSRSFFDTATLFFRKETSKSGTFELSRITKKYETDSSILFNFLGGIQMEALQEDRKSVV